MATRSSDGRRGRAARRTGSWAAAAEQLRLAIARAAGARLLTRDRRAEPVYRALGVEHELLL